MIRKCYKQAEFVGRIQQALGVALDRVSCSIVDRQGMAKVMQGAGWSRNDSAGVVGFQVDEQVYVLDSAPWTVLHELIHRAGVNSDRLSRFVAEGLTESIAQELKRSSDEHRPTYPVETRWVQQKLLPVLGMNATQLGRALASDPDPPRKLASLMAAAKPGTNERALRRQLGPQKTGVPSFNRMSVTRMKGVMADDRGSERVGLVLLLASAVLLVPPLLTRSQGAL